MSVSLGETIAFKHFTKLVGVVSKNFEDLTCLLSPLGGVAGLVLNTDKSHIPGEVATVWNL